MNTKIAEESEDNDMIDCLDETKDKPDLITNSFAYLKLSDDKSTSLELKSVSLREPNEQYFRRSSNHSQSYSANSKSNVIYFAILNEFFSIYCGNFFFLAQI